MVCPQIYVRNKCMLICLLNIRFTYCFLTRCHLFLAKWNPCDTSLLLLKEYLLVGFSGKCKCAIIRYMVYCCSLCYMNAQRVWVWVWCLMCYIRECYRCVPHACSWVCECVRRKGDASRLARPVGASRSTREGGNTLWSLVLCDVLLLAVIYKCMECVGVVLV